MAESIARWSPIAKTIAAMIPRGRDYRHVDSHREDDRQDDPPWPDYRQVKSHREDDRHDDPPVAATIALRNPIAKTIARMIPRSRTIAR